MCLYRSDLICIPYAILFDLLPQIAVQIMLDNLLDKVMQQHVCSVSLALTHIICSCRSARLLCPHYGAWHTHTHISLWASKQFKITIMLTLFNLFSIEGSKRAINEEIVYWNCKIALRNVSNKLSIKWSMCMGSEIMMLCELWAMVSIC